VREEAIAEHKAAEQAPPKIAVLGGDKRELLVMGALLARGWRVAAYGRPAAVLPAGVEYCAQAALALNGAAAAILPAPPLKDGGRLYNAEGLELALAAEVFACLPAGAPLLAGVISPWLRQVGAAYELRLIETLELDEIALPFAIATAEGALAVALSAGEGVLAQQRALIIGYGRIGRALAPRLRGLEMEVLVANRGAQRLEQAAAEGFATVSWPSWPAAAPGCAFIFNTAPHMLLDAGVLPLLKQGTVIIDLAAAPGGADFALAHKLGIQAQLASGLPGKYAPRFAGAVMADIYPRLLQQHLLPQGK
jgi:dipicolinate synthase subunit A